MRIHVPEPFPSLTHARTRVREVEREKEKGRRYFVSHAICRQKKRSERKKRRREKKFSPRDGNFRRERERERDAQARKNVRKRRE